MPDTVVLNPGVGGDIIIAEEIAPGPDKMEVTKIRLGAHGIDGGNVSYTNPFPTDPVDRAGRLLGLATVYGGAKGLTVPAQVTSTSIDADHQALDVNVAILAPATSSVAIRTQVVGAVVDTILLAANASRRGATIFNDAVGGNILHLAFGNVPATTTNYTVELRGKAYYEVPYGFTGTIRGVWSIAAGFARVTELS